jgi:hypothetical protein
MSNWQHMVIRVVAVAVLVALHWFPHTHAAPLLAAGASAQNQSALDRGADHADSEPVGVATIP